ncbi:unnamed protein product, partial [Adineta steineri]
WINSSNMNYPRYRHTASILPGGKILVAGGLDDNSAINTVELYDPSIKIWTTTSNMIDKRWEHTASILTNGKVLIT